MRHPCGDHLVRREQPQEDAETGAAHERGAVPSDTLPNRPDDGRRRSGRVHGGIRPEARRRAQRPESHCNRRQVHQGDSPRGRQKPRHRLGLFRRRETHPRHRDVRRKEQRDTDGRKTHRLAGPQRLRCHGGCHVLPKTVDGQHLKKRRPLPHRGQGQPEDSKMGHRGQT